MNQSHWGLLEKVATGLWPVVTLLIGVFAGGYIANRNQRKHWLLDNKRAEYRRLLTVLADAGSKFVVFYGMVPIVATPKQQFIMGETARRSVDVIYNRLFIAGEIQKLGIQERWENAISAIQKSHDINAFGKAMDGIMDDIRKAAIKDFS